MLDMNARVSAPGPWQKWVRDCTFLCPVTPIISVGSTLACLNIVTVVARMLWFVYRIDRSAASEMMATPLELIHPGPDHSWEAQPAIYSLNKDFKPMYYHF